MLYANVAQVPTSNATFFVTFKYQQVKDYFLPIPCKNQCGRVLEKNGNGRYYHKVLKIINQKVALYP